MNVEDHNMAINSKETPQFNMQHMHHLKKNLDIIKKDPSRRPQTAVANKKNEAQKYQKKANFGESLGSQISLITT